MAGERRGEPLGKEELRVDPKQLRWQKLGPPGQGLVRQMAYDYLAILLELAAFIRRIITRGLEWSWPGFVDGERWARQAICSAERPQAELDDYRCRLQGESYIRRRCLTPSRRSTTAR